MCWERNILCILRSRAIFRALLRPLDAHAENPSQVQCCTLDEADSEETFAHGFSACKPLRSIAAPGQFVPLLSFRHWRRRGTHLAKYNMYLAEAARGMLSCFRG